jgi:hypothetical protein
MLLLREDGSRLPKHVGENTVSLYICCICILLVLRNISHWMESLVSKYRNPVCYFMHLQCRGNRGYEYMI